jgi:acetylglutamate kinase
MIIVKFGGHAMKDENGSFSSAILNALASGERVVVVHGGGPQIDAALKAKKIESAFVGGFRYTTPEIFSVVEQVLSGEVGPMVAKTLVKAGVNAQAVSGRALPTLIAKQKNQLVDGTQVDLGQVGDVIKVDTSQLNELVATGIVPVLSPLATDLETGEGLNINADLAAAAIAGALDAKFLIIMTDVTGIYRNWPDKTSLIDSITQRELESIKSTFAEGMAPKVQATLDAIAAGAKAVRIIDGTDPESFTAALQGTGGTLVTA